MISGFQDIFLSLSPDLLVYCLSFSGFIAMLSETFPDLWVVL